MFVQCFVKETTNVNFFNEASYVTTLVLLTSLHDMLDQSLVKIDITTLLQKIIIVFTFRWAQISRVRGMRLYCAIPQMSSLFGLLCVFIDKTLD